MNAANRQRTFLGIHGKVAFAQRTMRSSYWGECIGYRLSQCHIRGGAFGPPQQLVGGGACLVELRVEHPPHDQIISITPPG